MRLIDKIKNVLKQSDGVKLQELYDNLPEHTPASIRGNLNRYLAKGNADIVRVDKGLYTLIQVIDIVEKDGQKIAAYQSTTYGLDGQAINCFYTDYVLKGETDIIPDGVYDSISQSAKLEDLENQISNLRTVLINGDAVEVMKKLKSESFDLLVTDCPYPVISGGKGAKNSPKGMLKENDGKIFKHNDIKFEDWLPEVYRLLKEGSHGYLFINFLNLEKLMAECRKVGFEIHNLLVWEKNNATPNRWYMKNCEYVVMVRKGKAFSIKNCGSKTVHKFDNILGTKIHETEKPVDLLRMYIQNSSKGGWVLEPFAGSMSTARACLMEGVRSVNIELDQTYQEKSIKATREVIKEKLKLDYCL